MGRMLMPGVLALDLQADASQQQGVLLPREKKKDAYNKALVKRYKHLPEVKRIVRHRHVPTAIHKVMPRIAAARLLQVIIRCCLAAETPPRPLVCQATKVRRIQVESDKRKTNNRIKHSAPGAVKVKPARKKKVVTEQE